MDPPEAGKHGWEQRERREPVGQELQSPEATWLLPYGLA
jgi:hypothetical protein